jgi:hypothetical protein
VKRTPYRDGNIPEFGIQYSIFTSQLQIQAFLFESRDLKLKMIPATINPALANANTMTIDREFSLAEGSAMALRINIIKPMIISIEGKYRLFLIVPLTGELYFRSASGAISLASRNWKFLSGYSNKPHNADHESCFHCD